MTHVSQLFATEISCAFSSGIIFEFGAYAADITDVVTGVFDNARVSTLAPLPFLAA